jgi:hypothetical protein
LRRRQSGSSHFLERGAVEIGGVHPWATGKAKLDALEPTLCPLTKAEDNRRSDDDRAMKARHAAAFRARADALEIEAPAKRRLAYEYDAAQERGEVATSRDGGRRSKLERLPSAADVCLSRSEITKPDFRDAEGAARANLEPR